MCFNFIRLLGIDWLKSITKELWELNAMIFKLPQQDYFNFCKALDITWIAGLSKNKSDVQMFLSRLPSNEKFVLAKAFGEDVINSINIRDLWRGLCEDIIDDDKRREFLLNKILESPRSQEKWMEIIKAGEFVLRFTTQQFELIIATCFDSTSGCIHTIADFQKIFDNCPLNIMNIIIKKYCDQICNLVRT